MKKTLILSALIFAMQTQAETKLTLDEIKSLAIEHNIQMHTADNEIKQAELQKKAAFTHYFPQISAVGGGMRTNEDIVKAEIKPGKVLPAEMAQMLPPEMMSSMPSSMTVSAMDRTLIAGVTATQPVYMGGQIVNGNRLAKLGIEVSQLKKQQSYNEVSLTAEQYYWQIVSLMEKQKTLDSVHEMLKKIEKDADVAVKAGVAMNNDLLSVQLKLNEVESNRLKLDNAIRLCKRVLAQYIGKEGQEIDIKVDVDPSSMPGYPLLKTDGDTVVCNTVEYQLLQKNVEAKMLQHKLEVGKTLPKVAVGAGYNYADFGDGMDNNFGMIFATVSVPLSDWWGGTHNIKRSKLAVKNAEELLEDNTQLLKIRVQKNLDDVDDAYKQLVIAKKSIEQSEENLRLNKDFYDAGVVSMNDFLEAQQKYQQSRDQYIDAYATLQTKLLEYKQSLGL
ncbi:MAG: TolC family protein [Paludibacteraceae bacterium]|nr:TolC family protein [Paludibacteraceae bacterium]